MLKSYISEINYEGKRPQLDFELSSQSFISEPLSISPPTHSN